MELNCICAVWQGTTIVTEEECGCTTVVSKGHMQTPPCTQPAKLSARHSVKCERHSQLQPAGHEENQKGGC